MLFYDFEVFQYDWLVVVMDMTRKQEHVIVNDPDALKALYDENVKDIWVGFNSRHYDQYILKGILCGFDPKKINDYIIIRGNPGWKFSSMFRNVPLNNYDVMNNTDWLFSRQRYGGEPFPVIHWEDGTQSLVSEDDLPLTLPELADYKPTGTGELKDLEIV